MRYTFTKAERLKSEKILARLFKEGRSYVAYPLRIAWLPMPEPDLAAGEAASPAQVAFSAPKRTFKTAVERNRVKRLMREGWRLHKHHFYEKIGAANLRIALIVMYIGKETPTLEAVAAGVRKAVRKFDGGES